MVFRINQLKQIMLIHKVCITHVVQNSICLFRRIQFSKRKQFHQKQGIQKLGVVYMLLNPSKGLFEVQQ